MPARTTETEVVRLLRSVDLLAGEVDAGRLVADDLRVMAQGYRLVARLLDDAADERTT